MLTATILAVFYIPLFFVLVRRSVRDGIKAARERLGRKDTDGATQGEPT
jgi:multidrug efflux pump